MRSTALCTIVGGALPLLLGVSFDPLDSNPDHHSWAYPVPVWAFLVLQLGLALSHWLVATGYLAISRESTSATARFALVGLVGTLLLGGCEVWSGLLARSDKDGSAVDALNTGYGVCSVLIAIGSIGAGVLLLRSTRQVGLPLVVGGVFFLVVATPIIAVGNDTAAIIVLTIWSLSYVWLGVALRGTRADAPASTAPRSSAHSFT